MALHRGAHPFVLPKEGVGSILLAVLFLLVGRLVAQDASALSRPYDWGASPTWDPAWFLGEDAPSTVLQDECAIRIRNTKPQFLALFFERKKVVHFSTEADILAHSRVVLPESHDPLYDRLHVPWDQRAQPANPRWLNVRLDHFAARVLRPDGSWEELGVLHRMERGNLRTMMTMENPWNFILDVQGIQPGDVVELRWKWMIPYDYNAPNTRGWRMALQWMDNWARLTSWRVFFHGTLPIRHQRLEIVYDLRHGLILGGQPPDERIVKGSDVRAIWEHKDLPGCIDEVNARPAEDLPHIVVQFVPEDFRYWRYDRLSGLPFEQPYWLQVARIREHRAFWWLRVSRKRIPDRQNQLVKDFVKRIGGDEGTPVQRMARIHDHIARNFTYDDDELWYYDLDLSTARIGEQARDGVLRDRSRYDLYAKLVYALQLQYATAYLLDRRVGRLNDVYLTPLWDSEFLFGTSEGDRILWMHPKRTNHGLLSNELPFYWQGSSALLIDLALMWEDLPPPPRFIDLPEEEVAGNVRGVEYTLDIDLETGKADGLVRVYLSGQFSTLGRAAYMGMQIDSTVDPLYGWRPTDVAGVSGQTWSEGDLSTDAPFRFRTETRIDLNEVVRAGPDSSHVIDLTSLIAHVVPKTFVANGRTLPFYWDFAQQDHFRFELRFIQAVEVVEPTIASKRVEGPGCSSDTRVVQRGSNMVAVERKFSVVEERVDVQEVNNLVHVIEAAWSPLTVRLHQVERPR